MAVRFSNVFGGVHQSDALELAKISLRQCRPCNTTQQVQCSKQARCHVVQCMGWWEVREHRGMLK